MHSLSFGLVLTKAQRQSRFVEERLRMLKRTWDEAVECLDRFDVFFEGQGVFASLIVLCGFLDVLQAILEELFGHDPRDFLI